MKEFNVTLNMHNYVDFEEVSYIGVWKLYYLDLISKATGEIVTIPMTEEQFDTLLLEMEENIKCLKNELQFLKTGVVIY